MDRQVRQKARMVLVDAIELVAAAFVIAGLTALGFWWLARRPQPHLRWSRSVFIWVVGVLYLSICLGYAIFPVDKEPENDLTCWCWVNVFFERGLLRGSSAAEPLGWVAAAADRLLFVLLGVTAVWLFRRPRLLLWWCVAAFVAMPVGAALSAFVWWWLWSGVAEGASWGPRVSAVAGAAAGFVFGPVVPLFLIWLRRPKRPDTADVEAEDSQDEDAGRGRA